MQIPSAYVWHKMQYLPTTSLKLFLSVLAVLTWNVERHDDEQEVLVVESGIPRIGHGKSPLFGFGNDLRCSVQAQQFTGDSNRVQGNEQSVPGENKF